MNLSQDSMVDKDSFLDSSIHIVRSTYKKPEIRCETVICGRQEHVKAIVIYASRYGSTKGIAEFIAEKLRLQGTQAVARSVSEEPHPEEYDAVVIGSAVYMEHWLDEATEFVRRNRTSLAGRPVWLFSSGPLQLGPETIATDESKLEPKEIPELRDAIHPRDHRIFFGALDPGKLGVKYRMLRKLPAARAVLPDGDFRNWNDIESLAGSIAKALGDTLP
jgi:menaquinone-dependent protoporphyrinogen oxidase